LVVAASGEPRFDHDPDTLECKGLLIEEQRTNLLTYSEEFDNAAWTKSRSSISANATTAPDGTSTADKLVEDTTASSTHQFADSFTPSASTSYTTSVYVKAAERSIFEIAYSTGLTGSNERVQFNLGTESVSTTAGTPDASSLTFVGNGWYRCSFTCTASGSPSSTSVTFFSNDGTGISYTGDGTSGIYVWGAQLEAGAFPTSYISSTETFTSRASTATYYDSTGTLQTAAVNEERLTYNPSDLTAPATQLFEAQRTNLATYSEQFDNAAWTKQRASISANATTAPDGTVSADKLVEDSSSLAGKYVSQSISVSSGTQYTISLYAKQSERSLLALSFAGGPNAVATFNLSNGTVEDSSDTDLDAFSIQSVGDGWYRCTLTTTSTITGSINFRGEVATSAATGTFPPAYTGDGTSGIYIWGAQIEAGSYPTSYIPTTSSTVTRSADVYSSATTTRSADAASMTGTNFSEWYRQDEGSLYVEAGYIKAVANKSQLITDISDGTTANRMYLGKKFNSETLLEAGVNSGNTGQAFMLVTPTTMDGFKSAVAYSVDNMAHSVDASTVETDSSAAMPIGVNSLSFVSGSNSIIKKLAYYPKRLTNAQLQAVTEE